MRVCFVGDSHGNGAWLNKVVAHAIAEKCDAIMQVGDFGYWPNFNRHFLDWASDMATQIPIWWIDGNHEDHDSLDELVRNHRCEDGLVRIKNLVYVPRGHRWTWGSSKMLAMGGAWSIDQAVREPHVTWFPQEVIGEGDLIRVAEVDESCDVLVCHDAPIKATGVLGPDNDKDSYPGSVANREKLQWVVEREHPRLVIGGHYHRRNTAFMGDIRVETLNCDNNEMAQSTLIVDL